MPHDTINFDPDPKVLLALTHTPLKPLDALCELIDNGLDSFAAARIQGKPIRHPLLKILVPGETEARRGVGAVRVVDNGAGLDRDGLSNALRAGYSDKNKYDTLGLFGMGFNIATGKLGRRTTVTTARSEDGFALRVVVDLPNVVRSRRFEAPVEQIEKPANFDHGTIIEVTDWWPQGDPNSGFIIQLARIAKTQLRDQIGRRYSASLRGDAKVRVLVNDESVEPYEHCVWSSGRFVEHRGWGLISAQSSFDSVIYSQKRCQYDGTVAEDSVSECVDCGRSEFRTLEERVRGWVGIQRFDDNNRFGIDLIRNGRAIRVAEKDAFFNFAEDLESIKEYPTDQQTGRIVGEVHLDHVPVDFQKQDFQRSSEEWLRAMEFLRGGSLLPSKWPEGSRNESPVSKLFQGFRKVRNIGREHMYMGRWDETTRKAVRIGRDVETDFYQRFLNREDGYYDDARWWDLVERATVPPERDLPECSECGFQNLPERDTCEDCGNMLHSKMCTSCDTAIPRDATSCPLCGESQIPEVREPWRCSVCGETNGMDDDKCSKCNSLRGDPNPMAPDTLRMNSVVDPSLGFSSLTFELADGISSEPLSITTRRSASALTPTWNGRRIPSIAVRTAGAIELFLDPSHPLFAQMGCRLQEAVSIEAAQYMYSMRGDLSGRTAHSVQNIAATVLTQVWGDELVTGPEKLLETVKGLFERISDKLDDNPDAPDFYDELDQFEERELADRLISAGALPLLSDLRLTGAWLRYAPASVIARFFDRRPDSWFGSVWRDELPDPERVGVQTAKDARSQIVGVISRCLGDCSEYMRFRNAETAALVRVGASCDYLEDHLL